jgi:hypothetical protein
LFGCASNFENFSTAPMSLPNPELDRAALRPSRAPWLASALVCCCAFWAQGPAAAQSTAAQTAASAPLGAEAQNRALSDWSKLKAVERQALAPLAGVWSGLYPAQQRKWLEVSRNFGGLPPAEQAKMQERMRAWATLSPRERAQARLNFGKATEIARELSPTEKMAKWEAYQALPAQQRQKLAEQARGRSVGAAPAAQPVPTQKLAVLPAVSTARANKPSESQDESSSASDAPSSQ